MRVFVTVTRKKDKVIPIWNRTMLTLQGDCTCLRQLQRELEAVKRHVNQDVNQQGLALRDVDIKIEFI